VYLQLVLYYQHVERQVNHWCHVVSLSSNEMTVILLNER
jgi:hypothetical protein